LTFRRREERGDRIVFAGNDESVGRGSREKIRGKNGSVAGEESFDTRAQASDDGIVAFRVESVTVDD
jgi:hypothetical protein